MTNELAHECSSETRREFVATREKPYHFVDCGLPNIYLVGVRQFRCECGKELVEIPAIKQLMSLIARHVVLKNEALTGDEVRFLRKQLGQKAADFAAKVKLQPETLSRMETGKQAIGERTDNYIRIYYAFASKDTVLVDSAKEAIDLVLAEKRKRVKKRAKTFARIDHHQEWALEAAA